MADLLTPHQIRALAEQENLKEFIELLARTPYGRISLDIEGDVSSALEKIFYKKFIERMMAIVDLAPANIGDFLQSYYYQRFEVINLKRIIRGKYSNIPVSRIMESLIPIMPYRVTSYESLVEAENYQNSVQRLEGTHYAPLIDSMELSEKYDALWPVEIALSYLNASAVFKALERLSRRDRGLVRKIVQTEADVENFLIAAKHRGARDRIFSPEEMFPATYGIPLGMLREAMEAEDIKLVIEELSPPYNEILVPLFEGDVALIRSLIRRHIYDIARKGRATNDFGFNVVMAYLVFSEIEKDDLVGIAWGKTQQISSEDILKYLAVPNS